MRDQQRWQVWGCVCVNSLGKGVQVIARPKLNSLEPLPKLLLEVFPITGQHSDGRAVLHRR